MNKKVVFLSHQPQIEWYAVLSEIMKKELGFKTHLWVIGESDKKAGEKLGEFDVVKNLIACENLKGSDDDYKLYLDKLKTLENNISDQFINRDILVDRHLSKSGWDYRKMILYAGNIADNILDFEKEDGDTVLFVGEENILHYKLARRIFCNSTFVFPAPILRFKEPRLYFDTSIDGQWPKLKKIYDEYKEHGVPDVIRSTVSKIIDDITLNKRRTNDCEELESSLNSYKVLISRFSTACSKFINRLKARSDVESFQPSGNRASVFSKIASSAVNELHRFKTRAYFKKIAVREFDENLRYASYLLHYQPEQTVEGYAFWSRRQNNTIENIAASLPCGMVLLVKEHVGMQRNIEYYRELNKHPQIQFVDPGINSHDLIHKSEIVFTLTGSVCLEAMMYGKPVIALGNNYYKYFEGIFQCQDVTALPEMIRYVLKNYNNETSRSNSVTALSAIYSASYEATFYWVQNIKDISSADNIRNLTKAITSEMKSLGLC